MSGGGGYRLSLEARVCASAGPVVTALDGTALLAKSGRFTAVAHCAAAPLAAQAGAGSVDDALPRKFTIASDGGQTALMVSEGAPVFAPGAEARLAGFALASDAALEVSRLRWRSPGALRHSRPPISAPAEAPAGAAARQTGKTVWLIPFYAAISAGRR